MNEGACTVEEIMYCTRAGTRCGSCIPTIAELLEEERASSAEPSRHRHLEILRPVTTAA